MVDYCKQDVGLMSKCTMLQALFGFEATLALSISTKHYSKQTRTVGLDQEHAFVLLANLRNEVRIEERYINI